MDGYNPQTHPAHLSSAEALDFYSSSPNAVVLDVRSEASYLERHALNALNIPYENISDYAAVLLPDKDAVIICYCFCGTNGGTAFSAMKLLTELGYTNVFYSELGDEWAYDGTMVQDAPEQEPPVHRIITGAEAKVIVDSDSTAILLDVRNQDEYDAGHINGSMLIPVAELESRLFELPDKNVAIIVYCRAGARSATAYGILTDNGYTNVYDMQMFSNWPGG